MSIDFYRQNYFNILKEGICNANIQSLILLMNEINLLDNIKQISNQSDTKMVTISQNRMVRSPNIKTLKVETITWE